MKIKKAEAVALFQALGVQNASKWTSERLGDKLLRIDNLVDEDTELNDDDEGLLAKVIQANKSHIVITVLDGKKPNALTAKRKKQASAKKTKGTVPKVKTKTAAGEPIPDEDDKPEPAAKPGKKSKKKKAAAGTSRVGDDPPRDEDDGGEPAKKTATGTENVPGVREAKTRPYIAGQVIAKMGLGEGVTPAMIAEVDELYGNENPRESKFSLRNAWHAIRAWEGK